MGLGLDGEDGHRRVTRGKEFLLVGGSEETHERMQEEGLVEVIGLPAPVWLGAPLIGRRGCFGAVVVQHYSDPDAMTEADLPKLAWAARCMGVAIERSFVAEQREAERRHRMQALALSRDEAVRANQAKSTFLATMSHELRTPLNAILGYADLLIETYGEEDEVLASDLGAIRGSALHLRDLIDDVLDLTQVEYGAFEPTFAPVDLVELLAAVRTQSTPLAETNRNALVFVGERDAGTLWTDRRALFQAISNLVDNACKFTRDGRVAVRARRRNGEDLLVLEVSDTGMGIDPSLLPHLFEPFTQVDGSATRVHGGTGLGLAISRRLVEALGGTLTAASVPGRGSTFTVRLPAPATI